MSKLATGSCCALIAFVGWWITNQSLAQDSQNSSSSISTNTSASTASALTVVRSQDAASVAAQRIEGILSQRLRTPLNYEAEQLNIVLSAIAEEYDIPIVIDRAALDEIAVSPESEVTMNLRNLTLHSALNLMFREPGLEDLAYVIDHEVLLITTEDRRNETLVAKVYRVDDLLSDATVGGNAQVSWDHDDLIDLIISSVKHDSWMENGTGNGDIHFAPPGMLVISQPRHIHREIEDLLQQFHETRRLILRTGGNAKTSRVEDMRQRSSGGRAGGGGGAF